MAREETRGPQTGLQSREWVGETKISRGALVAVALVGGETWVDAWELHWARSSPQLLFIP